MAGVTTTAKDHLSHEMGMHTEGLRGRTQQRFFDITEENVGFSYPDALDVDFNKRAEIDAEGMDTRQINGRLRELMKKVTARSSSRTPAPSIPWRSAY